MELNEKADGVPRGEEESNKNCSFPHINEAEHKAHISSSGSSTSLSSALSDSNDLVVSVENDTGNVASASKRFDLRLVTSITTVSVVSEDAAESEHYSDCNNTFETTSNSSAFRVPRERSSSEAENGEQKLENCPDRSGSCIATSVLAQEAVSLSEKNTKSTDHGHPFSSGVLKELSSPDDILSLIPLKVQQGFRTVTVGINCVHADGTYLLFGSNAGCGFLYSRATGGMLKLLSESRSDVVTTVRLFAGIECQAALGTEDGKLSVFILSTSMATSARQIQKFTLGKVHDCEVTCFEWSANGMKLFSGDKKGRVYVVERDFEKGMCNVSFVFAESHAIVELCYRHMILLVSTTERTVIYHSSLKEGRLKPVGSKARNGSFGACFSSDSMTSDDLQVFCSRPGYRIWIADVEGKVTKTLLLKDLVSAPHLSIELENRSSEVFSQDSQFRKLLFYQDKYLLSFSDTSLFLVDPSKPSVVASNRELPGILAVTTTADEIFVLCKDRMFHRISENPDDIAIRRRRLEEETKESLNLQDVKDSLSEVKRNLTPLVGALQSTMSSFNQKGGQWSQRLQSQAKFLQQKLPTIKSSLFAREDTNTSDKSTISVPVNEQSSSTELDENAGSLCVDTEESRCSDVVKGQSSPISPASLDESGAKSICKMENSGVDPGVFRTENAASETRESDFLHSQDYPELLTDEKERGKATSVNSHFEKMEKIAEEESSEIVFVSKRKKSKLRQVSSPKHTSSHPKSLKQALLPQLDENLTSDLHSSKTSKDRDIDWNDSTRRTGVERSEPQIQPNITPTSHSSASCHPTFFDPGLLHATANDHELPCLTSRVLESHHTTLDDTESSLVPSTAVDSLEPTRLSELHDTMDSPGCSQRNDTDPASPIPFQSPTKVSQMKENFLEDDTLRDNSAEPDVTKTPLFLDSEDDEDPDRIGGGVASCFDDIYVVDDGSRDFGSEIETESGASEDEATPVCSEPVLLRSFQSFTSEFDDVSTSVPAKLRDCWSTTALSHQVASMSGADSYIWYINYFNQVYIMEECGVNVAGMKWKKLAKRGVQLCISPSGSVAWLVTKKGNVYATVMPVDFSLLEEPVKLHWQLVSSKVSLAALGNDSAWVVSSSGNIKAQFGISRSNTFSETWNLIAWNNEKIANIVATKSTIWCRSDRGELYAADIASIDAADFKWEKIELPLHKGSDPSTLQSITSDSGEVLFAADDHGILWFLTEDRKWWQVNASEYIDESQHLLPHAVVQSLPASVATSVHKVQRWMAGLVRAQHVAVSNRSIWIVHDKWKASIACGPITGSRWDLTNPLGVTKSSKWKCITTSSVFSPNHGSWLGLVWASRPNGEIFCFPSQEAATFHPLTLEPPVFSKTSIVCMSACKEALWLLYNDGTIYIRSGISAECLQGTKWDRLDTREQLGNAKIIHLSCGTQNVWAVDTTGRLYFRIGVTAVDRNLLPAAWISIDGCPVSGHHFTQVECGLSDSSIWALDNFSEVYVRTGVSVRMPVGDGWEVVPGSHAQQLFISNHTVWGLRIGGNLLKRYGISERNEMGDYWKKIRGHFNKIAATPYDEMWVIDHEEHLRHQYTTVYCPLVVEAQYKFNSAINTDDYDNSLKVDSGWEIL